MKSKNKDVLKYSLYVALVTLCFILIIKILVMKTDSFGIKTLINNISIPIAVGTFFGFLYEKYLWKLFFWKHYLILKKNYSGKLVSTFDSIPRTTEITVKQTLTSCNLHLKTNESESDSLSAEIIQIRNRKVIIYTYCNIPNATYRENSPIHYGTAILYVNTNKYLKGNYFTDRKTTGTITVKAH